ncbi:hypothetical protein LCGC14_0251410 [marine sediment metagenome]|uniref:Uncharacterized protein n=1 Tax=marine sediment metagenome TaxID=412755 RepID=A0A0F9U8Y5_9ZZZZ
MLDFFNVCSYERVHPPGRVFTLTILNSLRNIEMAEAVYYSVLNHLDFSLFEQECYEQTVES